MKLSTGICYYGRNILPLICLNPVVVKVWRDHIWEKKVPGEQHRDSFWSAVQLLIKGERVSFKLEQEGYPWPWLSLRSPVQGTLLNSWNRNLDHLLPAGKAGAQLGWDPSSAPVNSFPCLCLSLCEISSLCPEPMDWYLSLPFAWWLLIVFLLNLRESIFYLFTFCPL